jgi:hypothetical protein
VTKDCRYHSLSLSLVDERELLEVAGQGGGGQRGAGVFEKPNLEELGMSCFGWGCITNSQFTRCLTLALGCKVWVAKKRLLLMLMLMLMLIYCERKHCFMLKSSADKFKRTGVGGKPATL